MDILQKRKEILTAFIQEVWNEGETGRLGEYLAPRYTIHHDLGDPWDGQVLDLSTYEERLKVSRTPFPDQRFDIQERIAEGERVVLTWFWTGTHLGDMPGFPASGRSIHMSGATVYFFEGERISGHWQIKDRLGVYQQLRQTAAGT